MSKEKLSRRDFLRLMGLGLGSVALEGCRDHPLVKTAEATLGLSADKTPTSKPPVVASSTPTRRSPETKVPSPTPTEIEEPETPTKTPKDAENPVATETLSPEWQNVFVVVGQMTGGENGEGMDFSNEVFVDGIKGLMVSSNPEINLSETPLIVMPMPSLKWDEAGNLEYSYSEEEVGGMALGGLVVTEKEGILCFYQSSPTATIEQFSFCTTCQPDNGEGGIWGSEYGLNVEEGASSGDYRLVIKKGEEIVYEVDTDPTGNVFLLEPAEGTSVESKQGILFVVTDRNGIDHTLLLKSKEAPELPEGTIGFKSDIVTLLDPLSGRILFYQVIPPTEGGGVSTVEPESVGSFDLGTGEYKGRGEYVDYDNLFKLKDSPTPEPTEELKEPTPEPTEQIVVPIKQGEVKEEIDFTDRMQVSWNPEGAGLEGVQKALLRVAAELNGVTVEQIEKDLKMGKQVLCPVTHYKYDGEGNFIDTQLVTDKWDLSKDVEFRFGDGNWGGGISSNRRISMNIQDGSLIFNIYLGVEGNRTFDDRWKGTGSILEAIWRVLLRGKESDKDPWSVDWMKPIIIDLVGAWGPESKPLIIITR